ncbi:hypothetical protein [Bradyrhizobium sp.]|uniref:hypothetical protein n=1 Tax=Bradyrhizobium sp. TaxID=376 RepID=UPI0023A47D06|nr:hypothetical protein [Bradyrhizobium sp.]MDE1937062.1 hypothetical protein [Bradyrhizobium sp.]
MESFSSLAVLGVSLADYASAAEELISELAGRGILVPSPYGIDNPENEANRSRIRNMSAVFAAS